MSVYLTIGHVADLMNVHLHVCLLSCAVIRCYNVLSCVVYHSGGSDSAGDAAGADGPTCIPAAAIASAEGGSNGSRPTKPPSNILAGTDTAPQQAAVPSAPRAAAAAAAAAAGSADGPNSTVLAAAVPTDGVGGSSTTGSWPILQGRSVVTGEGASVPCGSHTGVLHTVIADGGSGINQAVVVQPGNILPNSNTTAQLLKLLGVVPAVAIGSCNPAVVTTAVTTADAPSDNQAGVLLSPCYDPVAGGATDIDAVVSGDLHLEADVTAAAAAAAPVTTVAALPVWLSDQNRSGVWAEAPNTSFRVGASTPTTADVNAANPDRTPATVSEAVAAGLGAAMVDNEPLANPQSSVSSVRGQVEPLPNTGAVSATFPTSTSMQPSSQQPLSSGMLQRLPDEYSLSDEEAIRLYEKLKQIVMTKKRHGGTILPLKLERFISTEQ